MIQAISLHQKKQHVNVFLVCLVLPGNDLRPVMCYNICYCNNILLVHTILHNIYNGVSSILIAIEKDVLMYVTHV
jgi:hypothetical protein